MTQPLASNFGFVGLAWPAILHDCKTVERDVFVHPTSSCFFARSVLERLTHHIWNLEKMGHYGGLSLLDMQKALQQKDVVPESIMTKMHTLRMNGNDAVHMQEMGQSGVKVNAKTAMESAKHLFDVLVWAVAFYSDAPEAAPGENQGFDEKLVGQNTNQSVALTKNIIARKNQELKDQALLLNEIEQQRLEEQVKHARERELFARRQAEAEEKAAQSEEALQAARAKAAEAEDALQRELEQLRKDLAKAQAEKIGTRTEPLAPFAISEAETRRQLIDPMLRQAGFTESNMSFEYELEGMPNKAGIGYADYVLWGDDGQPLAVVEAKSAINADMNVGAEQVRLYANLLEKKFGQRPVMFCTNGFEIRLIDDAANLPGSGAGYPARQVEGYPNERQLRLMIRRRQTRERLAEMVPDPDIAGRPYQQEVIRAVTETFEDKRRRDALLVMATGTGKTRVAIAAAKLLREANWVGKVLFLADRTSLVKQAHKNFKNHYADSVPINVLDNPDGVGEVYVSTYQTMMGLISGDGKCPAAFRPFDFDLIIVDEAHRSVYNRYKRILDYFDAFVLGLTATPRHEIGRDTYRLFDIDGQEPTGEYGLQRAIDEGYLVPFKLYSQNSVILRQGVRYEELSEEEKLKWDKEEWGTDEDGNPLPPPDEVDAPLINQQLFNRQTIRNVLKTVVEHGIRVGGDTLGKTIIFARNQKHAALIKEEFDDAFPEYATRAASVITHAVNYADSAIEAFANPESGVDVAISVDMLDTGIDVPEVVNLVFFKPVYTPTKFWQMIGRGTRLCEDLFGPGRDKTHFLIFDFCDNAGMFFTEEVPKGSGVRTRSLSEKLFETRVELLRALDRGDGGEEFRSGLASDMVTWVRGVHSDHIMVRPEDKPDLLRFSDAAAWEGLSDDDVQRLYKHVAHLPFGTMDDGEAAKRFDLVMLRLQLGVVEPDDSFSKLRVRVEKVAGDLMAVKDRIPEVGKRASFIELALDDEWWEGVTLEELEDIRLALRDLVRFIPKNSRAAVVMDIEDEMGELVVTEDFHELIGPVTGTSSVEKRLKEVLDAHQHDMVLVKLRSAKELTPQDLDELERIVAEVGDEEVDALRSRTGYSLPAFIRSLVGLDRQAMEELFADVMVGNTLTAAQNRFWQTVFQVLVHNGGVSVSDLFEAPFTEPGNFFDIFPQGQGHTLIAELTKRFKVIEDSVQIPS